MADCEVSSCHPLEILFVFLILRAFCGAFHNLFSSLTMPVDGFDWGPKTHNPILHANLKQIVSHISKVK